MICLRARAALPPDSFNASLIRPSAYSKDMRGSFPGESLSFQHGIFLPARQIIQRGLIHGLACIVCRRCFFFFFFASCSSLKNKNGRARYRANPVGRGFVWRRTYKSRKASLPAMFDCARADRS
jgi:hypothetical protein